MNNLLVLQSDFGLVDGAVSAMIGVALEESATLKIHHLTHDITPYNIFEGSYRLFQTVNYWPEGTTFVSVVDPGVGSKRKSVVAKTVQNQYIVTPNNGTLSFIKKHVGILAIREISEVENRRKNTENSYTFHGRDVYAYTGAKLASGHITFEEVGPELSIDEIVGQQHIIGKDKLLYRAIKADRLGSIILYGPPGVGKTTIARVIANTTNSHFCKLNATNAGIKDVEKIIEEAKFNQNAYHKGTILFIDEIHRFNKTQQDYLLPYVEDGIVILIGATTENPYFEVNNALLSRCRIFELKPLEKQDLIRLIDRTLTDQKRGLGNEKIIIDEDAKNFLADMASGDARSVLNALELAYLTTDKNKEGKIHISLEVAEECIQKKQFAMIKVAIIIMMRFLLLLNL